MIEFTFIIFLLAVGALISIKLPEEKAKRFWLVPKIWKYLGEPIRNYKLKNITYNKVVLGYFFFAPHGIHASAQPPWNHQAG